MPAHPLSARPASVGVVAVVSMVAMLTASAAPAHAGSRSFADPAGDTMSSASVPEGTGDIVRVRVDHGRRSVSVQVDHSRHGSTPQEGYVVYLDTARKHAGPEFTLTWISYLYGSDSLFRVSGWEDDRGKQVRCRTSARSLDHGVRFTVPRSCLRRHGKVPAKVRVGVWAMNQYERESDDYAPRRHRFYGWVRSGR